MPEISGATIFPACWKTKKKISKVKVNGKEIYVVAKGHKVREWQCSFCKLPTRHIEYESDGIYAAIIIVKEITAASALGWKERATKPLEIVPKGKVKEYNQCYVENIGNETHIVPKSQEAAKIIVNALGRTEWSLIVLSHSLKHHPALVNTDKENLFMVLKKIPIPEIRERSKWTRILED